MGAIRFRCAEAHGSRRRRPPTGRLAILMAVVCAVLAPPFALLPPSMLLPASVLQVPSPLQPAGALAAEPLRDAPIVWYEDDRRDIPEPEERDPGLVYTLAKETVFRPAERFFHPGRFLRRVGTLFGGDRVPPAINVNSLDEALNSSWFTNRIGLFPLAPEAVAGGPGGNGPDRSVPWMVVGAKTAGVTPGFRVRDARGDTYLIKFDPPGYPGLTIRAGVVSNRILHACGYNVPEDFVVAFEREDLALNEDSTIKLPDGTRRRLTAANLDSLLQSLTPVAPGVWHALASKYVSGRPLGPFDYKGRRKDDPNDRIRHQNRRELRGLRVFAAWLNHFDTKQHNSLDVFIEEDGRGHVKHYLIDFASTLGAGGRGPTRKWGWEYGLDLPAIGGRLFALGLHEDKWAKLRLPEGLSELGYLDNRYFDPGEWKPFVPNSAFANLIDRDGYWAAKIISAFTSAHLEAIVARAAYQDPRAADFLVRSLLARRDQIARYWFDRVPPLDFFTCEGQELRWRDLGAERGLYRGQSSRYRLSWSAVTAERETAGWTAWQEQETTVTRRQTGPAAVAAAAVPAAEYPFLALQCQVDRGTGWSESVIVYLARDSGRVVAVER